MCEIKLNKNLDFLLLINILGQCYKKVNIILHYEHHNLMHLFNVLIF